MEPDVIAPGYFLLRFASFSSFRLLFLSFYTLISTIHSRKQRLRHLFYVVCSHRNMIFYWCFCVVSYAQKSRKKVKRKTCWVNMNVGVFFATSRKKIHFSFCFSHYRLFCLVLKISAMNKLNSHSLQAARFSGCCDMFVFPSSPYIAFLLASGRFA